MTERVVGYVRVSTEDQAEHGQSLDTQVDRIRAFAPLSGLELVGEIERDGGKSAKSLDRPGLARAFARISAGEAGGILVSKFDRISRSVRDWVGLVEDHFARPDGPRFHSAGDNFDLRAADGRMVSYILMAVAQGEREKTIERTAGVMTRKKSRGERRGNLGFGTMTDSADPRRSKKDRPVALIPCPDDLYQLEMMRGWRRNGYSLQDIADELNHLGIPSKRGVTKRSTGRWSKSSVHDFLKRAPSDAPPPPIQAPGDPPVPHDDRQAVEAPA